VCVRARVCVWVIAVPYRVVCVHVCAMLLVVLPGTARLGCVHGSALLRMHAGHACACMLGMQCSRSGALAIGWCNRALDTVA